MAKDVTVKSLPSRVDEEGNLSYAELAKWYDSSRLDGPRRKPGRANNVVDDVHDLIGGVPRMAIWAHQNPGAFYTKIYARTLQSNVATEHSGEITIRTAIPHSPLDGEYEDVSEAE